MLVAANRRHRRGDGGERRGAVAAVLDDVLPPALGIRLARRRGECTDRIERGVVGRILRAVIVAERPGHRDVDRHDAGRRGRTPTAPPAIPG